MTWKEKLDGYCGCFINKNLSSTCNNPCNLTELKDLLNQKKKPTIRLICKTFIKAGIFTRKEIIFAITEIHESIYKSAERRLEEAVEELKKEGYHVYSSDTNIIKAFRKE